MTQAFNLSQLANNINSSGQLDATDGLVNAVPVTNGGTGASDASAARTNLGVPSVSGSGATGTWGISISGNASTATSATTATTATTASTADYATTAGNGGVTSVNGSTGAVSVASATTANVLAATAGASVGAVGTYAFLTGSGQTFGPGSNYAASSLYYSSTGNPQVTSPRPSGTWKAMGGNDANPTLFLRIS